MILIGQFLLFYHRVSISYHASQKANINYFEYDSYINYDYVLEHFSVENPWCYAGINLTGYHPPRLTLGPLIFPSKFPPREQLFSAKLWPLGRKRETKSPPSGIICLVRMASMKKKRNSIRAVSFQIKYNCPFDNFLLS